MPIVSPTERRNLLHAGWDKRHHPDLPNWNDLDVALRSSIILAVSDYECDVKKLKKARKGPIKIAQAEPSQMARYLVKQFDGQLTKVDSDGNYYDWNGQRYVFRPPPGSRHTYRTNHNWVPPALKPEDYFNIHADEGSGP